MNTQTIIINIDGKDVKCQPGQTVLDAALSADIYIPSLCYHPDLPSFGACGLCTVEVEGCKEPVLACDTPVEQDMIVTTFSPAITNIRQEKLACILANHPHACLVCTEKEGCAREPCSLNVPVAERCCEKLGDCELQRVADYIGIKKDTPRYKPKNLPVYNDEPVIIRDYNLCIGCGRCVRVCSIISGVNALGELPDPPKLLDSSEFPKDLKKNNCRYCGLCIDVCPTGALYYKNKKPKVFSPCQDSCPAHIDIPKFLRGIAKEKFSDALNTMYNNVPLPGTLGWICDYPCEETCRRAELDDPVSIRAMHRLAFEKATVEINKKNNGSGKKVAVIGAGPSGLSCAFFLARWGHKVTIYEAKSKPGGMLRYGIPSFRLPRDVFEKEIEIIQKAGVDIKLNAPIKSTDDLFKQGFNAIFIGIGAQISTKIGIKGEDDPRVLDALNFLSNINEADNKFELGKQVAVIGGGNTSVDSARTAVRFGSKVTIFYRRTRAEMPAYHEEINEAKKDGVDFRFLSTPISIQSNKNGLKVEFVKMKLGQKDNSGRPRPISIKDSNFSHVFNNVIIAIGQKVDPIEGIKTNSKGWIDYSETLSIGPGVYVGGDVVGPSSVVEAVAMGRRAAVQIHIFLGGREEDTVLLTHKPTVQVYSSDFFLKKRGAPPTSIEAFRCNQCDLGFYLSEISQPPFNIIPFVAEKVASAPEKAGVYILYDNDKIVIEIKGVSNLRQILEEKLAVDDNIKFFKFEEDPMYSKRESELLQQHIKRYGELPTGSDELDDLL